MCTDIVKWISLHTPYKSGGISAMYAGNLLHWLHSTNILYGCLLLSRIKSRLKRDHMKSHAVIEQNRKKIEKYERDLALLQEGGAKEGLRGKIEEGLKIPFV